MNHLGSLQLDRRAPGTSIRDFDWSATPLGARETWSGELTAIYEMMMASPFAMCAGWGPELTFIYNEAYIDFLAARHPAALGQPIKEVWHEVWADIDPLIQQAMAGEEVRHTDMHLVMTRKGYAEDTYWTFAYSPLWDGKDIVGFLDIAIETTTGVLAGQRRDVAETSLRELNATLEQQITERTEERNRIWQVSRDMLLVADLEGRWLSVNPAWTRVLGWTENELIGRTSEWMEHPDDQAKTRAEVVLLAQGRTTVAFENRFRTKAGDYRVLSWTAVLADDKIFATARDLTAEKAQAAALRQTEARASTYFDFSEDYLFTIKVDAAGVASFQDMNLATERIMGLSRNYLKGLPVALSVSADIAADITKQARLCLETGEPQRYKASRRYQEGQAIVLIEGRVAFVERFETGGGLVLFSVSDVTDQRAIEDALRQSQKMEAVGQLTGGLAHDFNNLLAVVTGNLELMASRLGKGRFNDLERFMASAQAASKRATALTHRLLAFSRRQTLDPKPLPINELVEDMREMINRTVGPEINVEFVGSSTLWMTFADPNQLENALLNLCINARDAMPDGGQLTIETSNQDLGPGIAATRDLPPGQYVALSVSDTGTGMSPELIARVFEPFFTTKPTGQGTGLGLSMVYGFARQSEGQVRIHSEVGRGTTVTIYLPRSGKAAVTDNIELVATPQQAECGRTILVVDDEAAVRMLVIDVLRDLGYGLVEASDGPTALKILQSAEPIDLLITDVGMPGMNGRQLADAARVGRPHLKTLFITGYAEASVVSHGHLDADMAVMTKPFALDVLANRVRKMIDAEVQG